MIWDIVGFIDKDNSIKCNSTWNTTLGDAITNVIGGSRFANVIGSDAKIVFDWEEMVMKAGSLIPIVGPAFAFASHGALGALLFGIGGDATMVFGNKTSFTYLTDKADCEFGVTKINVNWVVPSEINYAELSYTNRGWYYLPVIVAILGVLTITTMTLCLKYIWKFSSSNPWTVNTTGSGNPTLQNASTNTTAMEKAMFWFPLLETRWLALVKGCHTYSLTMLPVRLEGFDVANVGEIIIKRSTELSVLESELADMEDKLHHANWMATICEKRIAYYEQQTSNEILFASFLVSLQEQLKDYTKLVNYYESQKGQILADIVKKTADIGKAWKLAGK